jgi:hypothetical protein
VYERQLPVDHPYRVAAAEGLRAVRGDRRSAGIRGH